MTRTRTGYAILFGWIVFFLWLFPQVYYQNANGIFAGNRIVWADWAVHTTYATRFARYPVADWFRVHPLFINGPFNYPFLSALVPGFMLRLGFNYEWAMDLQAMFLCAAVCWLLFAHYRDALGSTFHAGLALTLAMTGGGLGFIAWFSDLATAPNVWEALTYPPQEYGTQPRLGVDYGNFLTNLLLPQRALQMGLVLGLVALGLLLAERRSEIRSLARQVAAGIAVGLLPVTHAHSFVSVAVATALVLWPERRRLARWWPFLAIASVLSVAMLATFHSRSVTRDFMGFQPGWLAWRNNRPGWVVFWCLNWSCFPFLATLGLAKTRAKGDVLAWAGLVLFLIANLVRFQPWDWDNTKIFAWSYVLLAPAAIEATALFWRKRKWWARALVVVMALSMTLSGWLELLRLLNFQRNTFGMYSSDELRLATELREKITPRDRVLVVDDHHDWVSAIAGAQILMGYDGWLGSWGFSYEQVRADIAEMFRGSSKAADLFARYGITYAVLSPKDASRYSTNQAFFEKYPLVMRSNGTRVYRIAPQ